MRHINGLDFVRSCEVRIAHSLFIGKYRVAEDLERYYPKILTCLRFQVSVFIHYLSKGVVLPTVSSTFICQQGNLWIRTRKTLPPLPSVPTREGIATSCNVQEENAMFAQEIRGKEGGEGDVPGFRGQQPVAIGHSVLSPSSSLRLHSLHRFPLKTKKRLTA